MKNRKGQKCKDGRIWGQNNKEAGKHLGILTGRKPYIKKGRGGYKFSIKIKKKMSKAKMGNKYGVGNKNWLGKRHSEKTKRKMKESRLKYMASGKGKNKETHIEIKIENELKRQGIPYMKQVPLEGIALVDFLLPNKIIVQADGTYWHSKGKNKGKDIAQDTILGFKGYKIFRFTETQINKSSKRCINKIFRR